MRGHTVKKGRFVTLGNDDWKKTTRTEWTNHNRPELGVIIKNGYCLGIPTLEEAMKLSQEIRWLRYNYVIKSKKLCEKMMGKYEKGSKK